MTQPKSKAIKWAGVGTLVSILAISFSLGVFGKPQSYYLALKCGIPGIYGTPHEVAENCVGERWEYVHPLFSKWEFSRFPGVESAYRELSNSNGNIEAYGFSMMIDNGIIFILESGVVVEIDYLGP